MHILFKTADWKRSFVSLVQPFCIRFMVCSNYLNSVERVTICFYEPEAEDLIQSTGSKSPTSDGKKRQNFENKSRTGLWMFKWYWYLEWAKPIPSGSFSHLNLSILF